MIRSLSTTATTTALGRRLWSGISRARSIRRQPQQQSCLRKFASPSSCSPTPSPAPYFGDAGPFATRVYHVMTMGLAAMVPIYFAIPDSYTEGTFNKVFGLVLSGTIAAHSHIGLNYVATDYVPKISKTLLGPARAVIMGLSIVTLLGLGSIAVASPGGIKATIKGVWNPLPKEDKVAVDDF